MALSLPQFTIVLGQERRETPSRSSCIVQLGAVAVGSGIVALPYAVSLVGYWRAVLALILIAGLTQISTQWLATCALLSNKTTYEGNAKYFLGYPGHWLLIVNLILLLIGGSAAMVMVSVESIMACPLVVGSDAPDPWVVMLVVFLVVSVLTVLTGDKTERLNFVSVISLACSAYFVVILCIQASVRSPKPVIFDQVSDSIESVSIMINSFIMSFYVFTLIGRLGREGIPAIGQISFISIFFIITPIYFVVGLVGFYAFDAVPANILTANWTINASLVETGRLAIALVNIVKLPLLVIPLRETVTKLFPLTFPSIDQSVFLEIIIFCVASVFDSVATLLALVGTTCGVCISFTVPALMFFQKQFIEDEQADLARRVTTFYHAQPDSEPVSPSGARNARNRKGKRFASGFMVVASVAFMAVGLTASLSDSKKSTEFIDVYRD